mmetsp:Transcript_106078/g.253212  ORF Transcript_106078/g.253212 Transcript_106078/m.253212 type:complete len:247 (+) Transcript_106078:687-1427(+)
MRLVRTGPSMSRRVDAATSSLAEASSCSTWVEVTRFSCGGCEGICSSTGGATSSTATWDTSRMPSSIFSRNSCSLDMGVAEARGWMALGSSFQSLFSSSFPAAKVASQLRRARPRRLRPSRSALLRVTPASSITRDACCACAHCAHISADGIGPGSGSPLVSTSASCFTASGSSSKEAMVAGRNGPTPAKTAPRFTKSSGLSPANSSLACLKTAAAVASGLSSGHMRRSSIQRWGSKTARTCSWTS